MIKRRFVLCGLAIVGLAAVWSLHVLGPAPAEGPITKPEASGTFDDPLARSAYEFLRLRDPVTGRIPPNIRSREEAFASRLPISRPRTGRADAITTSEWTFRGPNNVGGRTRALAFDASDPNVRTFLAGGVSGGVWRTTDEGVSWTLTNGSSQIMGATCIVQDRRAGHTGTWYYGTGEYVGASASLPGPEYFICGSGIFKSTDSGVSWTQLPSTMGGSVVGWDNLFDFVFNLAVDPSNPAQEEVYAATTGGIQRTTDGGATWTLVLGTDTEPLPYLTDVAVTPTGVVYAALESRGSVNGVFRSTDGATWTEITPAGFPSTYGRTIFGVAPADERIVYVLLSETDAASKHGLWKYTYVSGDGTGAGGSWADRSAQLVNMPATAFGERKDFDTQGGYDMVCAVVPDDPNDVIIGGVNLFRSTDGFATSGNRAWIGGWLYPTTEAPEQHADQHALVFSPDAPHVAYSGSDGGVWKTSDCMAGQVRWDSMNDGYQTTQYYTLALDAAASGSQVLIGGLQDNGTWWTNAAGGATPWLETFGGDGAYCAIADNATSGGYYYVSSQLGYIYRLQISATGVVSNSGWTRVDPVGVSEDQHWFVAPLVLDPSDTRRMYLATKGVGLWRNNDVTAIPSLSNDQATVGWTHLTADERVTALGPSTTPPSILYFGAYPSKMYKIENAPSAPGGTTPIDISGANFPSGAYVAGIAVDPADAERVLISISNYSIVSLFYTTDGGGSWSSVEGNLGGADGPSARGVAILPTAGGNVYYAGTSVGLFSTTSFSGEATVWQREGAGSIGSLVVDPVVVRPSDGLVVAGTHGGGVYSAIVTAGSPECATRAGDATGDNLVDILDLVRTVNDILHLDPLGEGARACADMDNSTTIDILDLVQIVNVILHPGAGVARRAGVIAAPVAWGVETAGSKIRLRLDGTQVGGIEWTIPIPSGTARIPVEDRLSGEAEGVVVLSNVINGMYKVLAYNPLGGPLGAGWITLEVPSGMAEGASAESEETFAYGEIRIADIEGRALPLGVRVEGGPTPRGEASGPAAVFHNIVVSDGRDATRISYGLDRGLDVLIAVFDLSGRRVAVLQQGLSQAGPYEIKWNRRDDQGHSLPSGIYFVRFDAGGSTERRKLLIVD